MSSSNTTPSVGSELHGVALSIHGAVPTPQKDDGTYYPLNISSQSIYEPGDESATSIAGTWLSPRTSFFAFLGGSGGWPMTEARRAARVGANPMETPQKDCIPIAAPGLMFYPVANTPLWNDPNVNIDSVDFGRITGAGGARTFTLNARIDV